MENAIELSLSRMKTATKMAAVKKERNDYTPTLIFSIVESGTVLLRENTLCAYFTVWRGRSVDPGCQGSHGRDHNTNWTSGKK
ncbi:MAG: hypothetical protein ISS70_10455 [Phycisphaerae bacterium]|nr:hypothetical protein [Phycisphaerae bacterium]